MSEISEHVHLHHSNNKKLVAALPHLLNPVSCQVLLNVPLKYLFDLSPWPLLAIVFYYSSLPGLLASVRYFLYGAAQVISEKHYQTVSQPLIKTINYLLLSAITHFSQVISTISLLYTPNTPYLIDVFQ